MRSLSSEQPSAGGPGFRRKSATPTDRFEITSRPKRLAQLKNSFLETFYNEVACRIVLVAALIITAAGWHISTEQVQQRAHERFEFESENTKHAIVKRLLEYEQALHGAVGLFQAMGRPVTRREWQLYVQTVQIPTYYPGIQAIGFSKWIERGAKNSFFDETRQDRAANHTLRSERIEDRHSDVVYIEPSNWRNRRALGYDMFTEPVRRAAMERSRDTGRPSVSGRVILLQETDDDIQAGFLMYVPVYRRDRPTNNVAQRRAALVGFVFSSFRIADLIDGILPGEASNLDFRIFDGSVMKPEAMLFETKPSHFRPASNPDFTATKAVKLSGRTWTVQFSSRPHFDAAMSSHEPMIIAMAGVVVNLLLYSIFWSLAVQRRRVWLLAERLRESEASLIKTQRMANIGSWSWNLVTGEFTASEDLCQLLGGKSDSKSRDLFAVIRAVVHPDDRERVFMEAQRQQTRGEIEPMEFRVRLPDGRTYFVRTEGDTERNSAGDSVRFIGVLQDITQRKDAEELFRSVVDSAPNGMLMIDRTGTIRLVNTEIERQFGYQRDELLGQRIEILVPEKLQGSQPSHEEGFFTAPQVPSLGAVRNLYGLRKDGTEFPVEVGLNPAVTPTGTHVVASIIDTTERKMAEERLRQSENRFRVMIDSVKDYAIFMLDTEGRVMTWNRGAEMTMGYKAEEVLNRHYSMFFTTEEKESGKPEEMLKIAYAEGQCDETGWRLHQDRSRFWANVVVSSVHNGGDRLMGYSHVTRDLTRRQRIIQELKAAKEEAETANQAKSEFLANISHEIRTPMSGIIGMAGLLSETEMTPLQREYCDIILRSSGSLLTVINEVLDFSKVEAGKVELEMIEFDVRTAVEEVTGLFAADAAAKQIELISFIRFDVPTALRGDPSRLRQILSNLVNNALKFTTRGEIVVRVSVVTQTRNVVTLHFEVVDTGIGIAGDMGDRLFSPFTQLDASTTRKFGGTGLGLAICKKFVDLMHGQIGVDSEPGKGSVFWFTIPLLNQIGGFRQPPRPRPDLTSLRVLVVEGNTTSRTVLTHYLDAMGISAQTVEHGFAALENLRLAADSGEPYDLALIDFRIPDMNGLELAQTIRQDPRFESLKLLLITSMGARGDAELAKQAGIDAYLTKPISLSCLSECVALVTGENPDADVAAALVTRHTATEMKMNSRRRVLVVDDNHINQKVSASLLENMGHRADVVGSGKEALEAFILVSYDIVLMDLQMPEMDGFEACRRIRALADETKRPVSIIAVTAHAMAGDEEKCLRMGFDGYVSKPIIPKELKTVMATMVSRMTERVLPAPGITEHRTDATLDLSEALAQIEGNRKLLCEISQMFLEIYPKLLEQIHDALAASDHELLVASAHTLASSAGQIGAGKAHVLARELEEMVRRGDVARAADTAAELDAAIQLVATAIADHSSPHYVWLHSET